MRKISIVLKEPVKGQKIFDFISESKDLSDQIALAREKAKMFPPEIIERIDLCLGKDGKMLNMTGLLNN